MGLIACDERGIQDLFLRCMVADEVSVEIQQRAAATAGLVEVVGEMSKQVAVAAVLLGEDIENSDAPDPGSGPGRPVRPRYGRNLYALGLFGHVRAPFSK
jgi:hypothetical protein